MNKTDEHNQRRCSLLLILAMLGPLLAACGGGGEETPSPRPVLTADSEPVTIRFAVYDEVRVIYEDLIQAFEAANPGLHIQLVSEEEAIGIYSWEWPASIIRLASTADVFFMPDIPEIVNLGLIRDLTPFIEADTNFQPDDFYPYTLENYRWDGGTWALPTTVGFELIAYNKEAFDEACVPYPEPGWTWDDFLTKARALTVREGDRTTRWGFFQIVPEHRPFIEGREGPLIDITTDPPTPRFDRPEVIEAVRWYTDLYLKEQVVSYLQLPDEAEGSAMLDLRMLKHTAAMWVETTGDWQWLNEQGMGIVPFPVDAPDSRTTLLTTRALAMSAGTSHPDAAWRWMNFLSRQDLGAVGPVRSLPARRSVAEASGFWDNLSEELISILHYALAHSFAVHQGLGYNAFHQAMGAILRGEKSVEGALAEAQVQAQVEIQEKLARRAEATPVPTFVVAPPQEKPVGEGAVTVTFIPGKGSSNLQSYRNLARQFHATHPDIIVEIKAADLFSGPSDLPGMAEQSDCFQYPPSLDSSVDRAAVLSLQPFLEADPSFTTDDFYPPLRGPYTWQGQLWGLPAEVQPYVIEYNQDLFDAAGLAYPEADWTLDDFLAVAQNLTRGEADDKQYGFVGSYEPLDLVMFVERLGGKILDDTQDPPSAAFDDPATIEAVQWYADLYLLHGVKPVFVADEEREALINSGRVAMWATPFDRHDGLRSGVLPFPQGASDSGAPLLYTTGYFISVRAAAPQACWEWIKFLTAEASVVQGLPARRSVALSEAYRQQVGAERAAAYLASIEGSQRSSVFQRLVGQEWLGAYLIWLEQAYRQMVETGLSPQAALAAAQGKADVYRACVIANQALNDPPGYQACLKQVDPAYPVAPAENR